MEENSHCAMRSSRRDFLKVGAGSAAGLIMPLRTGSFGEQMIKEGSAMPTLTQPPSPRWVKDLIIYQIATKGFTSPDGPQSGTFNSLRGKLAYLQELGVTGIWLSGYSLADPHHFHNIWTQYAVIQPDKLDPTLGTERDFKALIDESHRREIRVFLDVITHGVVNQSLLIKNHPRWFRGGSWHMTDYDWYGGHTDLDDWWVKIYTEYVTKYGVDGFRLDVAIFRPDLWERIRQNAAAAGHEIVIFEEANAVIPGVTDFTQDENGLASYQTGALNDILVDNIPGFYARKFGKRGEYRVVIQYSDDGSRTVGTTRGEGPLLVRLDGLGPDKVSRRWGDDQPDGIPDVQITVDHVATRPIENIIVSDDTGQRWQLRCSIYHGRPLAIEGEPPSLKLFAATLGHGWSSVQLSCHDNGHGLRPTENPYVAQGSRALFGYSVLLTPMIPIFFSGEEFNATFHPIPGLTPDHYSGTPGKGRWLYGCMLNWEELKASGHREMLEDVRKMIAVRKREPDVLGVEKDDRKPRLMALDYQRDIAVPTPYVRWNDRSAIVIAANRNVNHDAKLKLRIPLTQTHLAGHSNYSVSNLWPGGETKVLQEAQLLGGLDCRVGRDKSAGGGLSVLKVEPKS